MDAETKPRDILADVAEVARMFGVTKKFVPRLIEQGLIPAPLPVGAGAKGLRFRRRWVRQHLLDWVRERAEQEAAR